MRKLITVIGLAGLHMGVCKLVVAATMQIDMVAADASWATVALGKTLVAVTRVLYFPIITLSLYSRQWFPGNWINLPIGANSLLWGIMLSVVFWWWRKRAKSARIRNSEAV